MKRYLNAAAIETVISAKRFKMTTLIQAINQASDVDVYEEHSELTEVLGRRTAVHVLQGLIRSCFLIELVKTPKIETTKFEVRWATRLSSSDPRFASFNDCVDIFEQAINQLDTHIRDKNNVKLLDTFRTQKQTAYEIPFDYKERITQGKIHTPSNIWWYFDNLPRKVIQLRTLLLNKSKNPHYKVFKAAYDKIRVKTYLTDRVLTGNHKTNREKRWETHPLSVHFALRRTCQEVEYTLMNQLCHFDGFPNDLAQILQQENILTPLERPFRCPITLDPLSFEDFRIAALDPKHGISNFQVGHLNPLKAINDDPSSGHTANNISWISSDGNRIQGHLPLTETRNMIRRISENYDRFGIA